MKAQMLHVNRAAILRFTKLSDFLIIWYQHFAARLLSTQNELPDVIFFLKKTSEETERRQTPSLALVFILGKSRHHTHPPTHLHTRHTTAR